MIIKDLILTYISPLTYYFTLSSSPALNHSPLQELTSISSLSTSSSLNYLGFYNPLLNPSGSLLNRAVLLSSNPDSEEYLGEPLNIIISNQSSPSILGERGFIDYSRSLGQWNECARIHLGQAQDGNLGDGNGWLPEFYEMRESHLPYIGSCIESVIGGNHFRAYKQNGTLANSGAWFLSASVEVDIRGHHTIAPNGYNEGRDRLVAKALRGSRYKRRTWSTTVEFVEGLLMPGSEGVNHGIEQDGRIAVFTVKEY